MEEAKFRVGDVVRLRGAMIGLDQLDIPAGDLYKPVLTIPDGAEGVVKDLVKMWFSSGIGAWVYRIAIPEGRCYCFSLGPYLEFIEHQPSPEEIAVMYAEAR